MPRISGRSGQRVSAICAYIKSIIGNDSGEWRVIMDLIITLEPDLFDYILDNKIYDL